MSDEPTPLARALGRVATGLYLVTTEGSAGPLGFVGSFVVQVGIDPPTVCVAVGQGRDHLDAMRTSGRFALSILDADSQGLMGSFFRKDANPFDDLATEDAPGGTKLFSDAQAWLECKVTGEHPAGDHVVVFGEVTAGGLRREGDPAVHLRKNGLGY